MKMDQIVLQCPRVLCINNNMCMYGSTEKEHDQSLPNFMLVASEDALAFNGSKCQIKWSEITLYSIIISTEGMKRNLEKI